MRLAVPLLACALLSSCAQPSSLSNGTEAVALDTERARISYMVGRDMARDMASVRGDIDLDTALAAVRDVHAGRASRMSDAQLAQARDALTRQVRGRIDGARSKQNAANTQAGAEFLARNAKAEGVVALPSGLQYKVVKRGAGARPVQADTVRIDYDAKRLDGSTFESTHATDHPADVILAQVMPGLSEGLRQMPVGSRYTLWIPASLAYGERGIPGTLEPGSALVFDVELLEIAAR